MRRDRNAKRPVRAERRPLQPSGPAMGRPGEKRLGHAAELREEHDPRAGPPDRSDRRDAAGFPDPVTHGRDARRDVAADPDDREARGFVLPDRAVHYREAIEREEDARAGGSSLEVG